MSEGKSSISLRLSYGDVVKCVVQGLVLLWLVVVFVWEMLLAVCFEPLVAWMRGYGSFFFA
jgi:hypothetical protein